MVKKRSNKKEKINLKICTKKRQLDPTHVVVVPLHDDGDDDDDNDDNDHDDDDDDYDDDDDDDGCASMVLGNITT